MMEIIVPCGSGSVPVIDVGAGGAGAVELGDWARVRPDEARNEAMVRARAVLPRICLSI